MGVLMPAPLALLLNKSVTGALYNYLVFYQIARLLLRELGYTNKLWLWQEHQGMHICICMLILQLIAGKPSRLLCRWDVVEFMNFCSGRAKRAVNKGLCPS